MSVHVLTVYREPDDGYRERNVAVLGIYQTRVAAAYAQTLVQNALKAVDPYGLARGEFEITEWSIAEPDQNWRPDDPN